MSKSGPNKFSIAENWVFYVIHLIKTWFEVRILVIDHRPGFLSLNENEMSNIGLIFPFTFRQSTMPVTSLRQQFRSRSLGVDTRRVNCDASVVFVHSFLLLFPFRPCRWCEKETTQWSSHSRIASPCNFLIINQAVIAYLRQSKVHT